MSYVRRYAGCRPAPLAAAALLLVLGACAAAAPEQTQKTLQVEVIGTTEQNRAADGTPLPVQVSVYFLSSETGFSQASLFEMATGTAVLPPTEVVAERRAFVQPGLSQTVAERVPLQVGYLGLVAGYREIDGKNLRVLAPVPPFADASFRAELRADGLHLEQLSP